MSKRTYSTCTQYTMNNKIHSIKLIEMGSIIIITCTVLWMTWMQQLRKQGLSDKCMDVVFCAIILSIITYALSAWGGYVTKENINRINKTLAKAKRYGFCSKLYTFNELLEHYDQWRRMIFFLEGG